MNKRELIELVNDLFKNTEIKVGDGKGRIGSTQFRSMADICRKAECFDEIKLLIEYKTAKKNGWEQEIRNHESCGEVINKTIQKIKDNSEEKNVLKNIISFFGYLYWKGYAESRNNYNKNDSQKRRGGYNAV